MNSTVLVVDDEVGFLNIVELILRRAGYQVLTATNGLDAMEMIYTHRPDVVLLDDMLPGMNGGEICLHIKNDPQVARTPIIFYSAGARVRDPQFIQHIHADVALLKPFRPPDVLKAVQSCLQAYA